MITSLRKRHRYTWVILSVLLLLGFGAAWWLTQDKAVYPDVDTEALVPAYPNVLKSVEQQHIKLNLRADDQDKLQIEIHIKEPVPLPAPVLYLNQTGEASPDNNQALAGVGAVGLHRFPINTKSIKGIFFHSSLNGKIAYQTDFKKK